MSAIDASITESVREITGGESMMTQSYLRRSSRRSSWKRSPPNSSGVFGLHQFQTLVRILADGVYPTRENERVRALRRKIVLVGKLNRALRYSIERFVVYVAAP